MVHNVALNWLGGAHYQLPPRRCTMWCCQPGYTCMSVGALNKTHGWTAWHMSMKFGVGIRCTTLWKIHSVGLNKKKENNFRDEPLIIVGGGKIEKKKRKRQRQQEKKKEATQPQSEMPIGWEKKQVPRWLGKKQDQNLCPTPPPTMINGSPLTVTYCYKRID